MTIPEGNVLRCAIALLLAGCGCSAPPAEPDAGLDAGPGPCADYASLDPAALRAALLECGVCVPEAHEVIGVLGSDFYVDNYAIPEGMVFRYGHRLVLIAPTREQTWSAPFTDNEEGLLPFGEIRMVPVAGDASVWVLSAYRSRGFGEAAPGSAALYRWSSGWAELAAIRLDRVWPALALDTGELLAGQYSADIGYHLAALRPRVDGTVDVVTRPNSDLPGGWIERFAWRNEDGTGTVLLDRRGDWIPGSPGPLTTLLRLDADLNDAAPPLRFSIAMDDPLFDPRRLFPLPFVVIPREGGGASIASSGESAGLDSAEFGLVWLQEATPEGALLTSAPGFLVNGDDYPRSDEIPRPGGSGANMTIGRLPMGRTGVIWDEMVMGRRPTGGRFLQVLEADGRLVLPEPRYLGLGFLVLEDPPETREITVPSALDAADHAYMDFDDLIRPGLEPPELVIQTRVERLDEEMNFVWPAGRRMDECGPGELSLGVINLAGRQDAAGVWVVWIEVQHDRNGYRLPIVKVALLDEHGEYAW